MTGLAIVSSRSKDKGSLLRAEFHREIKSHCRVKEEVQWETACLASVKSWVRPLVPPKSFLFNQHSIFMLKEGHFQQYTAWQ